MLQLFVFRCKGGNKVYEDASPIITFLMTDEMLFIIQTCRTNFFEEIEKNKAINLEKLAFWFEDQTHISNALPANMNSKQFHSDAIHFGYLGNIMSITTILWNAKGNDNSFHLFIIVCCIGLSTGFFPISPSMNWSHPSREHLEFWNVRNSWPSIGADTIDVRTCITQRFADGYLLKAGYSKHQVEFPFPVWQNHTYTHTITYPHSNRR